ncbi:hypothetical protein B5G43_01000 [Flavonifractor sp. An92]|nr:hypothetical protein B5G43_01000 [Flavonifractor sp. An92]OUQ26427.1 hypothetical protein B5E80_02245 [Flavonifractor sp. An135]
MEETTSGGCGFFLAAFSRLASACPSDRVSRGVFSIFGKESETETAPRVCQRFERKRAIFGPMHPV